MHICKIKNAMSYLFPQYVLFSHTNERLNCKINAKRIISHAG